MKRFYLLSGMILFTATLSVFSEEASKVPKAAPLEIAEDQVNHVKPYNKCPEPSPIPIEPPPFAKPGEIVSSAMLMDQEPPKYEVFKEIGKPQHIPEEPKNRKK